MLFTTDKCIGFDIDHKHTPACAAHTLYGHDEIKNGYAPGRAILPPAPVGEWISYGPSFVPAANAMARLVPEHVAELLDYPGSVDDRKQGPCGVKSWPDAALRIASWWRSGD